MLQDKDIHITQIINSHAQMQSELLKQLQDCKNQLTTSQTEKSQLTSKNDELTKQLQQSEHLIKQTRQDNLDMQERVQLAQTKLQSSLGETCKAQQLATIELVKSQEHASQIQEYIRLNMQLHERLQESEKEHRSQSIKAEELKQQAEQQAVDRILQAEREVQSARQAEKDALERIAKAEENAKAALDAQGAALECASKAEADKEQAIARATKAEEEAKKALQAQKTALVRASEAEAAKEQILADLEALQNENICQRQKSEAHWKELLLRQTAATEQAERNLSDFQAKSISEAEKAAEQLQVRIKEMQSEFAVILENKLSNLESQIETLEGELRNERRTKEEVLLRNIALQEINDQALNRITALEMEREVRRQNSIVSATSSAAITRHVKLKEEDEDEDTTMVSVELSTQASVKPTIVRKRRARNKSRRPSKTPRIEVTPALTVDTSASVSTDSVSSILDTDVSDQSGPRRLKVKILLFTFANY